MSGKLTIQKLKYLLKSSQNVFIFNPRLYGSKVIGSLMTVFSQITFFVITVVE